jgi:1-acyl-sn-glycerol-3-phosphate acyltransferase
MQADRLVLRAVTDEIMYAILALSDQEYVDIYASTQKARLAKAARENGQADATPEPVETDDSDSAEAV